MHKLLQRQLRRAARNSPDGTVDYDRLLALVSAAYEEADKDRQLTQRAIGLVSEELIELNRRLEAEAKERLRDALESIPDGFILFDGDDRVVLWNRRFAEMYPELAELLPTRPTAEETFRARHRTAAQAWGDAPAQDYVRWRMQFRRTKGSTPVIHRGGDGRWFRTTERRTSDGGSVAISTDITELKQREADLREAKDEAESASQAKSTFLANMSHELRTPLNAILGFSEIMCEDALGALDEDQYRQYATNIHESGAHLLNLINDILDLAKIEAGGFELNECDVNVDQVIAMCRRLVEKRAREGGVALVTPPAGAAPKLRADERAVKQIILNLLSNAVRFTPSGGEVAVELCVDAETGFAISVRDTGIGISADQIPEVLKPFRQIDAFVARETEGTGLGLPLVKSMTDLHGGAFELASQVGKGTIATVRFPAERIVARQGETSGAARRSAG